ncbi:MAG TPA: AAA family ATPase, partial [Polyangiaceae bacterium]|nr:AAA family ATPase [Polyangiaceae bacterium]
FFAMELVRGADFLTYVQTSGGRTADPAKLRPALRQLVEGVQALHAAGKLHRDVKPSNVLCTTEGRVVLLDFGVATELAPVIDEDQTEDDQIVGTAHYMAPEQALREAPTPASDWYSVGVMLYEALVGAPPFVGSMATILLEKTMTDPPRPSERAKGVPGDLDELCRALLDRTPERRPSGPEILRLFGAAPGSVRAVSEPPLADSAAMRALVGREPQLRALREAFVESRLGRSITVCVGGSAGMGKSSVVQQFVDELAENGEAVVLRGRAYEREAVPYKAVDSVIDALSRYLLRLSERGSSPPMPADAWALARLFPVLRRVPSVDTIPERPDADPARIRRRACDSLRELVASLGKSQPLVVYIDDVQWGDTDSASLLLELVRQPAAPALLLVLTYRQEEAATPFLAEMRARWPEGAAIRDVAVGPLDPADSRRLALAMLGSADAATQQAASAIARESGGNPFLIHELARSSAASRLHGAGLDEAKGPKVTLEQVVGERLARLPPDGRRLLEIVALGGRPLPVNIVGDASGVPDAVDSTIRLLCARRFVRSGLRDGHEVVETVHDRIRETIVAQISESTGREYHLRLACALESAPNVDVEALAMHWLGAGESQRAGAYAERAADQATAKLAFDQAARLLQMRLGMLPAGSSETRRVQRRLAEVFEWAGRGAEAAPVYLEAADGAPELERVDLERAAAEQLLASGKIDMAGEVLRRVLGSLGMNAPHSAWGVRFWLLIYGLWARAIGLKFAGRRAGDVRPEDRVRIDALYAIALGFSVIDPLFARCMKERHLIEAMRAGDAVHVSRAAALCAINGKPGATRVRALAALAQQLAAGSGDSGAIAYAHATQGVHLYLSGRWKRALEELDGAYTHLQTFRAGWQSNANLFAVNALCLMGQLDEGSRRIDRLLYDAEQRGDLYLSVNLRTGYTATVWLARDDADTARRRVREAMARWSRRGFFVQHWYAMLAEVDIHLYLGDGAAAYERLQRDAASLKKSLLLNLQTVRAMTHYLRGRCSLASLEASHAQRSARLADARRRARALEREGMGWTAPLAAIVGAGVANASGDAEKAVTLLREAARSADAADMPLHAASARHQLGLKLGGDEGRELVDEACSTMTARGVQRPERFARMFVPGRWDRG